MNRWRAIHMAVFFALSGVSMSASAGSLGPTSRGSVSISITVPPHVVVRPVAELDGGAPPANALCIATNGVRQFHVALLDHGASAVGAAGSAQTELVMHDGHDGAYCASPGGPGGSIAQQLADQMVTGAPASAQEPLTLLIVPD